MSINFFQLPNQIMAESEWKEEKYSEHANLMVQFIGNSKNTEYIEDIDEAYRAYNNELGSKEEALNKKITGQYGDDLGIEYTNYPLVEMTVDQLVSEYMGMPLQKTLYSINKRAINEKLDHKVMLLSEDLFRKENEKIKNEIGLELPTENPEVDIPDDIEEFHTKNYKTSNEELVNDLVEFFLESRKEKRTIKALLYDYFIGEECTVFIDKQNGHPKLFRAKYNESYVDLDPDKEVQDDPSVFAFYPFKTKNQILNEFDLNKTQRKKIDEIFDSMNDGSLLMDEISYRGNIKTGYNCPTGVSYKNWTDNSSSLRLRCFTMMWKSRKQIRVKVFQDEYGNNNYKILSKDYKARKRDTIETTTVEVARYIKMLGPELILDYGELDERMTYIDDKKSIKLPIVSLKGRNNLYGSELRSVAKKLIPLQRFASDLLFELRIASKNNNGRALVYDMAQVPKFFIQTFGTKNALSRVLHHLKKDKIIVFNSKDRPGKNTFNQFTSVDLSNRGQISDLISGLAMIEDLARKFVGLSKERQGEVDKYQTASGTDAAIMASNARTEVYYSLFDDFYEDVLERLMLKSRYVYKKGEVFPYMMGGLRMKFLTISEPFFQEDIAVYFGDRFKNKKSKEIIDRAASQALSTATDKELILDLINVLDEDYASEAKGILERSFERLEELNRANSEAMQQAELNKQQHEKEIQAERTEIENKRIEADLKISTDNLNNKLRIKNLEIDSEEKIALVKFDNELLKEEIKSLKKNKS